LPGPSLPAALVRQEQAACFVVRDHNRRQLAYFYFEDCRGGDRRRNCSRARRIAVNIAKLPELLT